MGDLSGFFACARPLEAAVFVALIEKAETISGFQPMPDIEQEYKKQIKELEQQIRLLKEQVDFLTDQAGSCTG